MRVPVLDERVGRELLAEWIADADHVLIGAGAGLSAAAGYDYADTARFATLFPAHHRLGFRARYELIGHRLPDPLHWGYWANHVADVRFGAEPNAVYTRLRSLVGDRDVWVITSNVDALFARNGFDTDRVFSPQGDYALMQCQQPCRHAVWDSRPAVERALAAYDPGTGEVTDPGAIPRCPSCGGEAFLNVRIGPEFVDNHLMPAGERLVDWLADARGRLLVVELGAGFNTPGVVRLPVERIATANRNSRLLRVNANHPDVPNLGDRAIGVRADIAAMLDPTRCGHSTD